MLNALRDFVAFDFETTGLERDTDEIVEIGAVRVRDGRLEERFARLVKAGKPLSPLVESLTGLTPDILAAAVDPAPALGEFLAFADGLPLVAHNADFDAAFLQEALKRHGLPAAENPVFDSLLLARMAWPSQDSHRLEDLAKAFDMPPDRAHRALPDAERSAMLWLKAQERLAAYSPATLADLARVLAGGPAPWRGLFSAPSLPPDPGGADRAAEWPGAVRDGDPAAGEGFAASSQGGSNPSAALFAPGGPLEKASASLGRPWQPRAGQGRLAGLADRAFAEGCFLAVEADPGTGRTLACLAAAARHALASRKTVYYAAGSRSRADRIVTSEFPLLRALFGPSLRLAALRPPSGYLSPRKYAEVLAEPDARLADSERLSFLPLVTWRETTPDGDAAANNGFNHDRQKVLWQKVCADSYASEPGSFAHAARERAARAHVVVVTQDMVLDDLALDFALLPPYEAIVFDDAHRLSEAAPERLGREAGFFRLRHALQLIAHSKTEDRGLLAALAGAAASMEAAGTLPPAFREDLARLKEKAFEPEKQLQKLFNKIGKNAQKRRKEGESRIRYSDKLVTELGASTEGVTASLAEVEGLLESLAAGLEGAPDRRGLALDLRKASSLLRGYRADLEHLADPKPASEVYWIEEFANPHRALIRCAPRDSGAVLAERYHSQVSAAVYVSSSLALADQLGFFCRQVGLEPAHAARVRTAAVRGQGASRHVAPLLLSRFTPMLAGGKAMDTVADMLARSLRTLGAPAFVHFTHVGLLKQARARLGEALAKDGRLVAAQHVDGSRESLLHLFRHRKDACLLGTDAFVEGLGPGDTLPEVVAITKLPFPVPSEPLVAAALERIQEAGENPLYDFLLPSAILRLKQELGRLPRTPGGRLALWILDPRLCTEKYARAFLRGLGRESAACGSEEDLVARTRDLWEGRGLPSRETQQPGAREGQDGAGAPGGRGRQGQKGQGGQGRQPRRGPPGEARPGGPRGPGGQGRGPRNPKGPGHRDDGRGRGTPEPGAGGTGSEVPSADPAVPVPGETSPTGPAPHEGMAEAIRPEGDLPAAPGGDGTD